MSLFRKYESKIQNNSVAKAPNSLVRLGESPLEYQPSHYPIPLLMKIEIKNLKVIESQSEETTCFTASLYLNSKHAGHVKNSGKGGSTDFHILPEAKEDFIIAQAQCKLLPAYMGISMDLELYIELQVEQKRILAMKLAKLKRLVKKQIIFTKETDFNAYMDGTSMRLSYTIWGPLQPCLEPKSLTFNRLKSSAAARGEIILNDKLNHYTP